MDVAVKKRVEKANDALVDKEEDGKDKDNKYFRNSSKIRETKTMLNK